MRRLGRLAIGAVGVVGLAAVHGALTGWSDWTYAVWGYRLEKRSALQGADWPRLWHTAGEAWPVFLFVVVGLVGTAVVLHRSGAGVLGSRVAVLFVIWPVTALLGFLLGGQFFQHYWVILTFPIGALCGLLVGRLPSPQVRVAVVFVMLMPMLGSFVSVVHLPNRTVNERISGEQRSYRAKAAGEWLAEHRRPGDSLVRPLCLGEPVRLCGDGPDLPLPVVRRRAPGPQRAGGPRGAAGRRRPAHVGGGGRPRRGVHRVRRRWPTR